MIDLAESSRFTRSYLRIWLPLCRVVASILLFLLGTVQIRGKYRVPKHGGLLVLCNHLADLDPIVVQLACPRPIHFMAKSELFEMRVLGRLIQAFGSFPVRRGEPDRAPLKLAVQLIRDGDVVVVFPEGEISETGQLLELKSGIALIARMTAGCPVICCGIQNTQAVIPYGKVIPRPGFKKIIVTWGEPKTFDKDATTDEILKWTTGQLQSLTT